MFYVVFIALFSRAQSLCCACDKSFRALSISLDDVSTLNSLPALDQE